MTCASPWKTEIMQTFFVKQIILSWITIRIEIKNEKKFYLSGNSPRVIDKLYHLVALWLSDTFDWSKSILMSFIWISFQNNIIGNA